MGLTLVLYSKCNLWGPTSAMLSENLRGQDKEAASSLTPQVTLCHEVWKPLLRRLHKC